MLRKLCLILIAALMTLVFADVASAQANAWPVYPSVDPNNLHAIERGTGHYLSWIKIGLLIGIYLLWVRTTEWANKDCQILKLPYPVWNPIIVMPFVLGLLLALTIPIFPAGAGLFSLCYLGPLLAYVVKRNSIVEPQERVMTPAHIRFLFATQLQKMGIDMGVESKESHEKGAAVDFTPLGGTAQQNQSNIIHARQTSGYITAKELIAELIRQRADKCMMDFTRDAVAMKFQIDGVWHDSEGQDRENGDLMLGVFKKISNLNVDERRKRQVGKFKAAFEDSKYNCTVISQGTQAGERVILQVDRPQSKFSTLEELGMREKMRDSLREMVNAPKGVFLFSAPPAGGLSSTVELALSLTDRYTRDFVAFQDAAKPEHLVENIDLTTFDAKAGDVAEHGP